MCFYDPVDPTDQTSHRLRVIRFKQVVSLAIWLAIVPSLSFGQQSKTDPYFPNAKKAVPRSDDKAKIQSNKVKPANEFIPAGEMNSKLKADNRLKPYSELNKGSSGKDSKSAVNKPPKNKFNSIPVDVGTRIKSANNRIQNTAKGDSFEPGRVLAKVGGHPIFYSDLAMEASQIIDRFIPTAPPAVKEQEKRKLVPKLLPKYINSKLMYVDVVQGLPDSANLDDIFETTSEQFDDIVVPKLMEQAKVNSPAHLDAHFRAMGSSLRKMRRSWSENELVKYMMKEKINIDPEVSHREMFDYYQENKQKFVIKAKVRWEQVMVRFNKFPSKQKAYEAIAKLGNDIYYGASFAAVAKNKSHGFKADQGGQQGWTTRGSLKDKNLDKTLFTIEPNKLSEIVQTEQGYHIVRVLERSDDGYIPFTDAQVEIRKQLVDQKKEKEFEKHLAKIRERIPVEVFEPGAMAQRQAEAPGQTKSR